MSKLRVHSFSISIDGYGAGPDQDLENPLGVGGLQVFDWFFPTRTWQRMHGGEDGENGDIVVDAILAVFATVHTLPGASREEPVKHLKPANAERILEILIRPGPVPINGDGETVNAKFRHKKSLLSAVPECFPSGTMGSSESELGYVAFANHSTQ